MRPRRLWRKAAETLDRPNRRWALAPLATARTAYKQKSFCLVWPMQGGWAHLYPGGRFLAGAIGIPGPRQLDEDAREIFLFACRLGLGDVVLDVGAGAGEEMLTFSRMVGTSGRVIAVEAHPLTYGLLVSNCSHARLRNVEPFHRAIADHSGTVHLTDDGASLGNRISSSQGTVPVPASTLDDLVDELGIAEVTLLKMNIEGAERSAIDGMRKMIRRTKNVCISCHDFLAESSGDASMMTSDAVLSFLLEEGFRIQRRSDDLRPWVRDYLYGTRESV